MVCVFRRCGQGERPVVKSTATEAKQTYSSSGLGRRIDGSQKACTTMKPEVIWCRRGRVYEHNNNDSTVAVIGTRRVCPSVTVRELPSTAYHTRITRRRWRRRRSLTNARRRIYRSKTNARANVVVRPRTRQTQPAAVVIKMINKKRYYCAFNE